MHAERRRQSRGSDLGPRRRHRPRVVIFAFAETPEVEVLELPEGVGVGDRICHGGRTWRVTGSRTGARVLIAEPEAH